MSICDDRTWHAPPGYRVVPTDERIYTEQAGHVTHRGAQRRADALNDAQQKPSYEWRAVRERHLWRVVAFRNRLEQVSEAA